jgi:hypothetical protein
MKIFLSMVLCLVLYMHLKAQTFELPFTEKVKLNSIKVYRDKNTNDLFLGLLHKNKYQVILLNDSLKLKANDYYEIKDPQENEAEHNTSVLTIPGMHKAQLNRTKPLYHSYKNGELVHFFMEESTGAIQYTKLDTKENKFTYNNIITLEKNEFPVWLHFADEKLYVLTIIKKSNTVRYCQIQHTTILKDEKHEIDLSAHYASGILQAEKNENFSSILPTVFMKGLPLYALMSSVDPGVFAPFDQLTGINRFFYQNNEISFYNNNAQKRTFRCTLSLKDFSTKCTYVLPSENDLVQFEKTPVAKQNSSVAEFDVKHDIKTVNESANYISIVKIDKPHIYILHINKATNKLVRVEYFSNEDYAQLDKGKIFPATHFFKEKENREANPEKFAKVAAAKLGTVAMLNIEMPNGNILSSMIVRDDRVKLSDFTGLLAETATLLIPVGGLAEAFLVGAAGSVVTDAFDAASWAASLKGTQMHSRLFDASFNELPYTELPKIPEIQKELNIIATLPNNIPKDSEKVDFLDLGNAHILAYYDKETKTLVVKKVTR